VRIPSGSRASNVFPGISTIHGMEKWSDFIKTTFEAKKTINSVKIMMKSEI
jgi:hypothetical protein